MFSLPSLLLLVAAWAPFVDASVDACQVRAAQDTELDFENSVLGRNDLQLGGLMVFENIGTVEDRAIDLEISVVPGTTYESPNAVLRNGKNPTGKFGVINLFTVQGDPEAGEGSFRFCLKDHETGDLATAKSFVWSVFDVDDRNEAENGIKEKMEVDLVQVEDYVLWPNEEESEIESSCENSGSAPPCASGERTVFAASGKGTGEDNPVDPDLLSPTERKRTIVFSFKDTSCWDFSYHHYCKIEEEEGGVCRWYGGGNFLFAGGAREVIEEGECIDPPDDGCEDDNPDPFFWKGKDTSCAEIAALGPQKRAFKCNEGRRIERECPSVCLEGCATPGPTVTPTADPYGRCGNNPEPFEFKGKITSCDEIADLGPQKEAESATRAGSSTNAPGFATTPAAFASKAIDPTMPDDDDRGELYDKIV
eukprot:CAMPEP_0197195104 /NCGR_PEP_ID=MMETSP1423-20130617/30469_1 /TAXON_ID=476441 /ORGANISM="Pseudo-nitzschia heimii, Strain UNC1101" /LENGTH=421 /DNA_ID=CAMNT_0042648655 /DNA_START=48 /DNA_END=1311 /DNA_ORIENTATION=-